MQKLFRYCFALLLSAGAFASCSQDRSETEVSAPGGGESVTLSLSAEVSLDDDEARALNHQLGKNANNRVVPMPVFGNGDVVKVHTILKSSAGTAVAKTLKWTYDAKKKKLVLGRLHNDEALDDNSIPVSGFNNDGSVRWYISGLIGGTLENNTVRFAGTRAVTGVELVGANANDERNIGKALGHMEVPYAFPWTEVTIDTKSTKDSGTGSYRYARVPATANVKFKPLGTIIAVKLGNKQRNGAHSFTPESFTLSSNVWGDRGTFNLDTDIPSRELPTWTESASGGRLDYSFASDADKPGEIAHSELTKKTYYVWVMANKAASSTTPRVFVTMSGKSSDTSFPAYASARPWLTDYKPSAATGGKVTSGKVQSLNAYATHTIVSPLEHVTDYNLAGGESYDLKSTSYKLPGTLGERRFADSHRNDQSGLYNWYQVAGRYDRTYNEDYGDIHFGVNWAWGNQYFIPELDDWWGVFPSNGVLQWTGSEDLDRDEYIKVGFEADTFRGAFKSDYSRGFTTDNDTQDAVVYAIRFKGHPNASSVSSTSLSWGYDPVSKTKKTYSYEYVADDSWKCAYRYRRVKGASAWDRPDISWDNLAVINEIDLDTQVVVDAVYLGNEAIATTLAQISNPAWWDGKKKVTKTFPASGYGFAPNTPNYVTWGRGGEVGYYWTASQYNDAQALQVAFSSASISTNGISLPFEYGCAVRLFRRRP